MARKPRVLSDLGFYHVMMRGNDQQNIFYDEKDKNFFKSRLKKYADELGIIIYSYTLMNNHVHLEIGNATETMGLLVKKLACSYVPYFNKKYNRSGHLFQGRYISEPIYDVEYFMNTAGYIINNPEKAGYCKHNQYKWSSYSEYFSNKTDCIVDKDYLIKIIGSQEKLKHFFINGWNKNEQYLKSNKNMSDDLVIAFINQLYNIKNPLEISHLDIRKRNSILKKLIKMNLPVPQLSRIFAISKGILYKIN